jgi:hypothetical protein
VNVAPALTIRAVCADDLDALFAYLNDHLSDNGVQGKALFMPLARSESRFGQEREAAFRGSLILLSANSVNPMRIVSRSWNFH